MLLWINGAFGVGKTQTAFELQRRLPNAHVADPEFIGYGIHRMLPASARVDFQDRPQWRSAVVATLTDAAEAHDGTVLVPMTLVDAEYFDEIMSGLERNSIGLQHFSLTASPATLRRRLRARAGYRLGRLVGRDESWALAQIDRCVAALAADRFATHVDTDDRGLDDVVEFIAERAGLELEAPRLSTLRYQARRVAVAVRHIHV
ncbi:AAA family ATPase [[Mycobacterium] wendilense]|uniref:AAA family ATPase n=1 Tax=[Mycobacterium] wendilense TaxID=3064284 RepID=A0ABN9NV18_9MYCO|nr:AAA family ATPase [Mycolicibacterium sp. MU0050]CAJ1580258.1 AAA family ATPase [Mycolicibacterium sp. MU0050]